jgi:small subunit ribosomal protein S2e
MNTENIDENQKKLLNNEARVSRNSYDKKNTRQIHKRKSKNKGLNSAPWVPVTHLGRLVQKGEIKEIDLIYRYSLCIKEHQIVDQLLNGNLSNEKSRLKEEVMGIMPVQKQTTAGQRTRFKAFVVVGDLNGHIGLGWKTASERSDAIRGAVISAKMSLIPVRRGYWKSRLGNPHTICCKLTGKCGSVRMRLIPAPRGAGLVVGPGPKKLLEFAGLKDCYSSSTGHTRTKGNFLKATYFALQKSYGFLSPDLWGDIGYHVKYPYDKENNDEIN